MQDFNMQIHQLGTIHVTVEESLREAIKTIATKPILANMSPEALAQVIATVMLTMIEPQGVAALIEMHRKSKE